MILSSQALVVVNMHIGINQAFPITFANGIEDVAVFLLYLGSPA